MIAIAAAIVAVHANGLTGPFVFDDQGSIIDNDSIRVLGQPLAWFSAPAGAGVAGRPCANFTLALNYAVSGLDPWSYHALNVALHALSALALYGIVRRTLQRMPQFARGPAGGSRLALAVAAIWAAHPLATAAVDYVSQRTELLAALCQLLRLYGFIRSLDGGARARAWAVLARMSCR